MVTKPILIIGAPRSGTSMLQKILRGHPLAWSLPSESDLIWAEYCHPKLRGWESEALTETDITPESAVAIRELFQQYICPASFWKPLENTDLIWGFQRWPRLRRMLRPVYQRLFPFFSKRMFQSDHNQRMIEKTASNCFRLGFVNQVFPDAKIIYPIRHGYNNINSLINGWLQPKRFFTYDLPEKIDIKGYPYNTWKFVLPPGWRDYKESSLEEVCAFQWQACHKAMLAETTKSKYQGRIFQIKLEELTNNPKYWLPKIADFIEFPYDNYFESLAGSLPIVNSPDQNIANDKWRHQNPQMIERIIPMIKSTMQALGYE